MTELFVWDTESPEAAGLREVERSLTGHPAVGRAAALVYLGHNGNEQLAVYAEPAPDVTPPTGEQLREFLAGKLPGYAVPDAVIVVESLPMARSGEVDHEALPDPRPAVPEQDRSLRAGLLREVFAAVLGAPAIRARDNFFDVGGHSLLATRLVNQLRTVADVDIVVRDVFDADTMGDLIERLDRKGRQYPSPLPSARRNGLAPASLRQRHGWFARQQGARSGQVIPIAMRLTGALDREAMREALLDVIARHPVLRTRYHLGDGVLYQVATAPAEVRIGVPEVATTVEELAARLDAAVASGFDSAAGLPLRAALFVVEADEHVLSLVLDGTSVDRRSAEIVRRDLARAYAARRRGQRPIWQLQQCTPADWAIWESMLLGAQEDPQSLANRQLADWREVLADVPAELALPVDRARPERASCRSATVPLQLSAELVERLAAVAGRHKVTLLTLLQAATAATLSGLGAGSDIPIGTTVDGRWDPALDDAVGVFANRLVLRIDTSGAPTFGELLARVRTIALAADARRELPFERIADELQPDCPAARHPLFQVAVELTTVSGPGPQFAGLSVADVPVGAPFDLDLSVDFRRSFDAQGVPIGLDGELRYSTDLFDPATAASIGRALTGVLATAGEESR